MAATGGKPGTTSSSWSSMNAGQKWKHIAAHVTVEPIIVLYAILAVLAGLTTQNLSVQKACRISLNLSAAVCDDVFQNDTAYTEVAKVVANMQVWQSPLQTLVPIILVMFVGSWADRRRRRKPFLLAPLVGNLLCSTGLLLCSIFFSWPLEVGGVIEALVPALFGDPPIILLSIFAYVAVVSSTEDRTFRIGMVSTAASVAATLSTALSGVAFTSLGFAGVYSLHITLGTLTFAYGYFRLQEPEAPVPRPPGTTFLADFFNWHHVWETVAVSLRKRPGTRRLQLFLVVVLYFAIEGPILGESGVIFLYLTQRYKWETVQVSAFLAYTGIIDSVGAFLVTTVLSKWLKMSDCLIGLIGIGSNAITSPLFAQATTDWQVYAVYGCSILGAGAMITMRGIASKVVETEELGKVMSSLAVVEAVIPLVFITLYSKVYSATLESHPGVYLYISTVVGLIGMLLYSAIWWLQCKEAREEIISKKNDELGGVANAAFDCTSAPNDSTVTFENCAVRL